MRQFENIIATLTLNHDGKKGVLVLRGPARDLIAIRDQVRKDNWVPKGHGTTYGTGAGGGDIEPVDVPNYTGFCKPTPGIPVYEMQGHGDAFARPRHNVSKLWWTAMTGLLAILITGTMLVLKHF